MMPDTSTSFNCAKRGEGQDFTLARKRHHVVMTELGIDDLVGANLQSFGQPDGTLHRFRRS